MTPRIAAFAVALALAGGLAAAPAPAQTLYKLIDKNGKVTYSEKAPKDYDGKVIRIDVDPNANTATLPKAAKQAPAAAAGAAAPSAARQAEERLETARKALADAQDHPAEEDMRWVGNVGGGVRRVPTEAYARKLEALQQAVKEAEDDARKASR